MSSSVALRGTGLNRDESSFFDEAARLPKLRPELFDSRMLRLSLLTRAILAPASELTTRRRFLSIWNHCIDVLNIYFLIFTEIYCPTRFFGLLIFQISFCFNWFWNFKKRFSSCRINWQWESPWSSNKSIYRRSSSGNDILKMRFHQLRSSWDLFFSLLL